MKNKYNQFMDSIVVTPEMESRIIDSIKSIGLVRFDSKKFYSSSVFRRAAVAAALILIVTIGGKLYNVGPNINDSDTVTAVSPITEYNSFEDFNLASSFDVPILKYIPFEVRDTNYVIYTGTLSQVTYIGDSNSITFRMDETLADISGDYNEYGNTLKKTVGKNTVIFKGNNDLYNLAIWNDGVYSFSVYFDKGIEIDSFLQVLK